MAQMCLFFFPLSSKKVLAIFLGMTVASQMIQAWKAKNENASNAELARQAGVPTNTIRYIILGRGATAATIAKLRRVRGLGDLRPEHFISNGSGK